VVGHGAGGGLLPRARALAAGPPRGGRVTVGPRRRRSCSDG
jgi:hypothetical protein